MFAYTLVCLLLCRFVEFTVGKLHGFCGCKLLDMCLCTLESDSQTAVSSSVRYGAMMNSLIIPSHGSV